MSQQVAETRIRGQVISLSQEDKRIVDLKYGKQSGVPYGDLRVRCQNGKYEGEGEAKHWVITDESYFNVRVFKADAEKAATELKLFDEVFIEGKVTTDHWDKKDSTGAVMINEKTQKPLQNYKQVILANLFVKTADSNFKPAAEVAATEEALTHQG